MHAGSPSPSGGSLRLEPPGFAGVSDAVLLDDAGSVERERRVHEGLLIARMVEIERRRLYVSGGWRCLAGWGRGVHRWSDVEARSRRNLTHLVIECPQVLERMLAGRLGVAQAHLIGRTFRAPRVGRFVPWFIDDILDSATTLDVADFEMYLKEWKRLVDVDGPDPARAHRDRQASVWFGDHEFQVILNGPNIDGTKFKALLARFERIEFDTDWTACRAEHGDEARPELMRRSSMQRRYDAFMHLLACVQFPADTTDPNLLEPDHDDHDDHDDGDDVDTAGTSTAAHPTPPPASKPTERPRPVDGAVTTTVDIVIDLRTFLTGAADLFRARLHHDVRSPFGPDRGVCHTLDGIGISPLDAVLAALHGSFRLVITGDDGVPIQITSTNRFFTGRIRDAVLMTAVRCTHPGCLRPNLQSHIDHTRPWSEGGPTSIDNGNIGCGHHNLWRYTTGARVSKRPDHSWATHLPDGTDIAPPM